MIEDTKDFKRNLVSNHQENANLLQLASGAYLSMARVIYQEFLEEKYPGQIIHTMAFDFHTGYLFGKIKDPSSGEEDFFDIPVFDLPAIDWNDPKSERMFIQQIQDSSDLTFPQANKLREILVDYINPPDKGQWESVPCE